MKTNLYAGLDLIYRIILIIKNQTIQLTVSQKVRIHYNQFSTATFFNRFIGKPKYSVVYCGFEYFPSYPSKKLLSDFPLYPIRIKPENNPLSVMVISINELQNFKNCF